ncbi:glucokinase [Panacagrimonas sp.]|uniref:glucokinase n=1 Tax=Panacagrimonas sp. TaxID=2480088 RepID=UPI003B52C584
MTAEPSATAAEAALRGNVAPDPRIAVADVGGTQCRLAIAVATPSGVRLEHLQVISTPRGDFTVALRTYLDAIGCERPAGIAVAAAGRVRRLPGRSWVSLTNTQLNVERESLASLTSGGVWLANDLAAVAAALPLLGPAERVAFGPERDHLSDLRLVVGVGTGFGAAALPVEGGVIETEAGHVDLAAVSAEERQWLNRMAPLGRLAVEQVLSGPGLLRLYEAVSGVPCPDYETLLKRLDGHETAANKTLAVFSSWLGRVIGNLVLNFGAWGGVYLTGGVIAGLSGVLDMQAFRRSFEDKAPFTADLGAVPVYQILHPQPALVGMARMATAR